MDELFKGAVNSFVSALFGFIAAVATFRSQFATMKREYELLKEQIERDRQSDKELLNVKLSGISAALERSARVQNVLLDITSNMARAQGINHRAIGADALANLIAEDNDK